MSFGRPTRGDEDPFAVLGLPTDADEPAIVAARRALAKAAHPDAGGGVGDMQRINEAADRALALVAATTTNQRTPRSARTPTPRRPTPRSRGGAVRQDHPSFTIEALPAEAFEGVLIAASWLGEVADDEPPYLLEVLIDPPTSCWCRLELVPDAGASTVSLTVAARPGHPYPDLDDVRDRWLRALNQVDWSALDPNQQRPW